MSALGLLNFLVLQWFGVRLARVCERRTRIVAGSASVTNCAAGGDIVAVSVPREEPYLAPVGWKLLRWIWPLTGWWSAYRWIARRA